MARTNEDFRRRRFLTQLGVMAFTPVLPACSFQAKPVTIGLHILPGYEPMPLARELGWLDERRKAGILHRQQDKLEGLLRPEYLPWQDVS